MTRSLKKYFPVFTGPTLIAFTIAFLIPFVVGVYLSFNKFTAIDDAEWVGLKNYAAAFSERSHFVEALTFTAMVTAVAIVTVNIGAFTLAYMLTRKLRGTNVFRTVFFLPRTSSAAWCSAIRGRQCSTPSSTVSPKGRSKTIGGTGSQDSSC